MNEKLEILIKLDNKRIVRVEGILGEAPKVSCQAVNPLDYPVIVKRVEGVYVRDLPKAIRLSRLYDNISRSIAEAML